MNNKGRSNLRLNELCWDGARGATPDSEGTPGGPRGVKGMRGGNNTLKKHTGKNQEESNTENSITQGKDLKEIQNKIPFGRQGLSKGPAV